MRKKLVILFMSVLMAVGMLPTAAFAADSAGTDSSTGEEIFSSLKTAAIDIDGDGVTDRFCDITIEQTVTGLDTDAALQSLLESYAIGYSVTGEILENNAVVKTVTSEDLEVGNWSGNLAASDLEDDNIKTVGDSTVLSWTIKGVYAGDGNENYRITLGFKHDGYDVTGYRKVGKFLSSASVDLDAGEANGGTLSITLNSMEYQPILDVAYSWEIPNDVALYMNGVSVTKPTDQTNVCIEGETYTVDSTYQKGTTANDANGNIYTFSGWYNGETPVSGTQTMGDTDVTLTGEWKLTAVPYTVEYYYEQENNGTYSYSTTPNSSVSRTGAVNTKIEATDADKTVQAPYENMGYILDEAESTLSIENLTADTKDPVIRVYFALDRKGKNDSDDPDNTPDGTPDRYQTKVTFRIENGTWSDDTEDDKIVYVTKTTDGKPDKNGKGYLTADQIPTGMKADPYYGNGSWDTDPGTETAITAPVTYIYSFVENEYAVTYVYDDDLPEDAIDIPAVPTDDGAYRNGQTYRVSTTPTKGTTVKDPAGNTYTFQGWTKNGNPVSGTQTMGNADVTLVGDWELTKAPYVVAYYYEESVGGEYRLDSTSAERTGTTGSTVSATNADKTPTKENYVFDGNRTENVLSTTLEAAETNGDTKTVTTLKVYFSIDKAGTNDSEPNNDPDKTPDEEPDGTPDRYQERVTFQVENGSWNDGTEEEKIAYVTLYKDQKPSETGTGYLDGDDIPAVGNKPDTGYKSGYDTANWNPLPQNNTEITNNGPDTFTYTYKADTCTVTFNSNGGSEVPPQSGIEPGKTATEPEDPTRDGYDFSGWTLDGEPYDFDTPVTTDITLDAQWTPKTYIVSFDPDGGEPDPDDQSVTYGNTATEPTTDPEKPDYTFGGWTLDGEPYDFDTPVTDDITLIAKWIPLTPTLTYESNGGTEYDPETYPINTVVTLDKQPTREGYTFTGWYADPELTTLITTITMTDDATVYAGWEANTVPSLLNGDDHYAYIIGYPNGEVRPRGNITRAEATTIFFRLLTAETRDGNLTAKNDFSDVASTVWYNKAVSTMTKLGIINGYSNGTFGGNKYITRAEFATICARFDTGSTQVSSGEVFSDISGHWAENYIKIAAAKGWVSGYPDGSFHPNEYITRAEAATMINRVLLRLPEEESDLLSSMTTWPDNPTDAWYYLAIQEATNSHDFDRKSDLIHETWTVLTETPDWEVYE